MKRIAALALAVSATLGTVAVATPASAASACHPVRPGGQC